MSISNIAKLHDFKTIELFFICQNSTFYCHIKYKIKRCTEKRLCHYASFGAFSTSSWYCLSLFVELTQKTLLWYWVWEFDQTKNCLAWTIYSDNIYSMAHSNYSYWSLNPYFSRRCGHAAGSVWKWQDQESQYRCVGTERHHLHKCIY